MEEGEPHPGEPGENMAEKDPLVGSTPPPYRSITPGRIRLGDGVPERTATKPQPQPEPEPEYDNPRTPGVPSSPGLASFGSLVSDVQSGYSEVIIESRLGWTQQKDQHSMHLAARQAQQVERHLAAGEKVQWSVSIEAYDIMVHARFLQRKNSGDTVTLVFREKRLGDPYSQDEGAMISGVFVAEVAGTLQISLDNSCVAPRPPARPPAQTVHQLTDLPFGNRHVCPPLDGAHLYSRPFLYPCH